MLLPFLKIRQLQSDFRHAKICDVVFVALLVEARKDAKYIRNRERMVYD
jgi:hypothetical protein